MEDLSARTAVASAAFVAGLVFGAVVQRTHFCTMGAIADLTLFGDGRRMRAWLLAIAVGLLGSQALAAAGIVDLSDTFYRASDILWLGALAGGLMFGFGMTLTGGCVSRNLVRLGAGNLKSLVVLLVTSVTAYITMNGFLSLARVRLEDVGGMTSDDQGLAALLGLDGRAAFAVALVIAVAIAAYCFKDRKFRASGKDVTAGLVLGALIPIGWLITGLLGADEFEPEPLASFTFVAPVARSLIYLMTYPAAPISFGIAAVGGVIVGGFLAARLGGDFRLEGFSGQDDLVRHLIGAAMMGVGGVLGLGCTIGQGMTGLSTLALGSVLTTAVDHGGRRPRRALSRTRQPHSGTARGHPHDRCGKVELMSERAPVTTRPLLDDCFAHDPKRMPAREALDLLRERVSTVVGKETVDLERAYGRYLAEPLDRRPQCPRLHQRRRRWLCLRPCQSLEADGPSRLGTAGRTLRRRPALRGQVVGRGQRPPRADRRRAPRRHRHRADAGGRRGRRRPCPDPGGREAGCQLPPRRART